MMAWFEVHRVLLLLMSFRTNFLLLLMILCPPLISSSHAKPCKCSSSDQIQRDNTTINTSFDQMHGFLIPANLSSKLIDHYSSDYDYFQFYGTLGSTSQVHNSSDDNMYFVLPDLIKLWEKNDDADLHEASFAFSFTMSIYRSRKQVEVGSLFFGILSPSTLFLADIVNPTGSLDPISISSTIDDSIHVAINISVVRPVNRTLLAHGYNVNAPDPLYSSTIWIEIYIQPPENSISMRDYTVWIEYDRLGRQLLVYVIDAGKPKPDNPIATIHRPISDMTSRLGACLGFFSSKEQLLQLHTWNSTVELLPGYGDSGKLSIATIVSVVLGSSVAMGAVVAATVYLYFNSKYRRWKKEMDQLAKSMQQLPGMPIQVNFSDIQKATNNFHETMKLGRGGFGAVYRCGLPAPVRGEVMEVAVKKFTRDDNRHYEDFLAEVSVINRLRHKNVVPLIGWSYNKGEPLLIYEYMPNGSLDQHLFRSGNQQLNSPICQWDTRYNIVMDVATGLQYVHHEYEPTVLHRDIKASNIMIDSAFQGRLGDFGLACTVDIGRNSYTDRDPRGTPGFIAHEYLHTGRATRKTDIYAFGVLILEIVTGKPPLGRYAQFDHITDWVWHHHREGKLLDVVDPVVTTERFDSSDARRLLLLGLACSSPNPSERPSMIEALQVITKLLPPLDVPLEKPRFIWPPPEDERSSLSPYLTTANTSLERSSPTILAEMAGRRQLSLENAGSSLQHRPMAMIGARTFPSVGGRLYLPHYSTTLD